MPEAEETGRAYLALDVIVVLGLLLILGFGVYALAFVNIPEKNSSLFAAIIGGVVGAGIMSYVNNRWGSSKGSAAKDATLATIARSAASKGDAP